MNLPGLSIIIVSLNCEKTLGECLKRISEQNYPKEKVEILLIDGGSVDSTKTIAEKFGVKIVDGGYRDNQEPRRYIGYLNARNEILVYIDSDNYLPTSDWLRRMVEPFIEDPEITATQTLHYEYEKGASIMNRYFALFGFNDPVAFYLGKADRMPWYKSSWSLPGKVISENDRYYKICFSPAEIPTIGCNGFLVRKTAFDKLNYQPEQFFHIDANYDLISKGLNKYGFVKNGIIHATSETVLKSFAKRIRYMKKHHNQLSALRKYRVFDSRSRKDILGLGLFILFSITILKPLYDSIRGFLKIRDIAWFLHPFICFSFTAAYGMSLVSGFLKK